MSTIKKILQKHVMEDITNLKTDIFKLWPERPTTEEEKVFNNCILGLKGLQEYIVKNSQTKSDEFVASDKNA